MNNKIGFLVVLFFAGITCSFSQTDPAKQGLSVISKQSSQAILTYLASDWMEGRQPGNKGHEIAADYLASMFQLYGLKPIEKLKDPYSRLDNMSFPNNVYFQNFSLLKLKPSDNHELGIVTQKKSNSFEEQFDYKSDFVTSDFIGIPTHSILGTFPIVFVGYGLVDKKTGYDDFNGIDVKGKIILRLRGYPGHSDTSSIAYKKFHVLRKNIYQYLNFEYKKNESAIQRGAIGCLEVNMENEALTYQPINIFRYNKGSFESDDNAENNFYSFDFLLKDSLEKDLIGYTISQRFANELTNETEVNISAFENTVKNNLKPASKEIKNKFIKMHSIADWDIIGCKNILGIIEGENPDEVVVVGAHYDHWGKYQGAIWNGSDDNASGTVAVLEIAKACMATGVKPKRTIVFAAWDAEEKGMYGSNYFLSHPTHKSIVANVNFDMISRNPTNASTKDYCKVVYTKPFDIFRTNTEKFVKENNLALDIEYSPEEMPSDGTDSDSFGEKNIPIINFETGIHSDYHKPSDHSDRANLTKMTDIIRLGFLHVWELANLETLN